LLQQANELTEARDCLERLVALAPTHVENIGTLSDLLIRMESIEDAESLLRAAAHGFGQQQKASQIWLRLAMLLERRSDTSRAFKALHNAALLDPHNPDIQLPYLTLMLSIGQPEAALVSVNQLLEQHPNHVDGLQRKAEILQCIGKNQESLALCKQARELDPERIDLQLMELYACHSLCDWSQRDQQLEALEASLQQRPAALQEPEQLKLQALPPFGLLTLPLPAEVVIREIDRWVLTHRPQTGSQRNTRSLQKVHQGNDRLRIGLPLCRLSHSCDGTAARGVI
jgi:tetratricopeptide (TPR) repeat protein